MKILYGKSVNNRLSTIGIENCVLKKICYERDYKMTTLKCHCHAEYELHMVVCGKQAYEVDGVISDVCEGEFIMIPPRIKHRIIFASENLLKYSATFNCPEMLGEPLYRGKLPEYVVVALGFISEEFRRKTYLSIELIENRIFEIFTLLFREMGRKERVIENETSFVDERIDMIKKFIGDNLEQKLSVADVAAFCHISPRQLTRIFLDTDNISPAKYINNERMKKIGELIRDTDMTLRQISERFSYNNEYYFNSAFKRYFGVPPLTYRKMFR